MPKFRITAPDGKSYSIEGDNAEGAMAALQQHLGGDAGKEIKPQAGGVDASTVYVDDMLFGLPGKASAALGAAIRAPFTDKSFSEEYDHNRDAYKAARDQYAEEHPVINTAASIAGQMHGGEAATRLGARALEKVAPRVIPYVVDRLGQFGANMAGDAVSGTAQGALTAAGHDEDVGTGAAIGGVVGGLARPILAAGGSVLKTIGGAFGIGNESRAQSAVAEALRRSGRTVDDVTDELTAAHAAGQGEYTVADVLGNSGQRMLTGVARSPGDARTMISEALQRRQAGQSERLINALSEGFDAPRTANQTEAALKATRKTTANANYEAARGSAGTVNPSRAIQAADDFLGPAGNIEATNIADDSVEGAVRKAKRLLTDGENTVTDFDTAFRAKIELDYQIENASPTVQEKLTPIRNALDDSLSDASEHYAHARNTFREQSRVIDAVDTGRGAASPRNRAADNIDTFNAMTPEQQQSHRVGYADQHITRIENASLSPTTNKARGLITERTGQEFPAFAAPGQADQLGERIAREQRMFETANQALGGSKTADNMADQLDVQNFDPTMLTALASGNVWGAAKAGLGLAVNAVNGRNQATRDMIARALMESAPTRANATLAQALRTGERLTASQNRIVQALISASSQVQPALN